MRTLGAIAPFLIALFGYSLGATLAAGRKESSPGLWDLAVVLVVWIAVASLRTSLGWWTLLLAALLLGALAGGMIGALRAARAADRRESERFSRRVGNFQSRLFTAFFYFTLVTPFAVFFRLLADPLRRRAASRPSNWVPRADSQPTVKEAQNQF